MLPTTSPAPNETSEEGMINITSHRQERHSSNKRERPSLLMHSSGREQEEFLRGYESSYIHKGESSHFHSARGSADRQSMLFSKGKAEQLQSHNEPEEGEVEQSQKKDVNRISLMQIIFNMKLKMLAQRLVHQLKSRMFLNLTPFQHKLIDDKSYVPQNVLSSLIGHRNRSTSLAKLRNSSGNVGADGAKHIMTLKGLQSDHAHIADFQQEENEENNFVLVRLLQRTFCSLETQKFLHQLSLSIPLFHPSSIFKIFWDFASMQFIVFFLIMIPIYVTFFDQTNVKLNHFLVILAPSYVVLDTLININSSYYEKGLLIKRRSFIIANYWKKYSATEFFIITVSIIHLIQVYNHNEHSWTRFLLLVFILKIQHCATIFRKFEELFISKRSHQIMDLTKLISVIMIIGHFISCLWLLIAQLEEQIGEQKTWLSVRIIPGNEWSYKYIEAFYFSMVTMVTVGYGDVLPITPIEKTLCVILMLVSCGIFAYSMNTIGHILENFNQEELIISKKMHTINTYMSNKNVSKRMQYSIREYLDYYWREASERDQDAEEKIIEQLSDQLRENLLIEANKIVLKQSSIFRKNFSSRIKQRIIPLIREYRCTPEEIICSEGDVDDSSIFFIEKGSVQFFIDTSNGTSQTKQTPLITLRQGDSFGELSFFTGLPRCSSVRSKEFTTLLMIKRENFVELLKEFPEDFEQFMAIKDSLCLYEDYQILDMHCYSCGSSQHLVYQCPFIHMKSNVEKIIFLFNKSPDQERNSYARIKKRSQNSIAEGVEYHQECAKEFISFNIDHPNVLIYIEQAAANQKQQSHSNSKAKLSMPLPSNELFDKDELASSSQSDEDNKTSVSIKNQQQQQQQFVRRKSRFASSIQDNELNADLQKLMHIQQASPISMCVSEEMQPTQQFNKDPLGQQQQQRRKSQRITNILQMAEVKEEEESEERSHQNNNSISIFPRRRSVIDEGHQLQQLQSSVNNSFFGKYAQEEATATSQGTPSNNLRRISHSQHTMPRLENSLIQKNTGNIIPSGQGLFSQQPMQIRNRASSLQHQVAELISVLRGVLPNNFIRNTRIPRFTQSSNTTTTNNSINSMPSMPRMAGRKGSKFFSLTPKIPSTIEQQFQLDEEYQNNNYNPVLGFGEFCDSMPNFDVMKNFDVYFPFNNLVYQLKLMGINSDEKRSKMLRNRFMNQQTLKCHMDSPLTTTTRFGNNNNANNSKSSIQKVVIKYQREMEEQENQNASEFKKSKFHTTTKIPGAPSAGVDSSIDGSSTFKTLNLINLHKNSASLSAGLKPSNKLSNKLKAQTSLTDEPKYLNSKNQTAALIDSQTESGNVPQSLMFPSNEQLFKHPAMSIDLHSEIFKLSTSEMALKKNPIEKESEEDKNTHSNNNNNKRNSGVLRQTQLDLNQIDIAQLHSLDREIENYYQTSNPNSFPQSKYQQDLSNNSTLKELAPLSNQKFMKQQDESLSQQYESFNLLESSDNSIQNINEINNLSVANYKPKKRYLTIEHIQSNNGSNN